MALYLLSLRMGGGARRQEMSEQDMKRSHEEIEALNASIRSAGAWVFGGALEGPEGAAVVDAPQGKTMVTDGPFTEAKEQIAGFYILEAATREEAVEWAAKTSAAVGAPIEVRAFRDGQT